MQKINNTSLKNYNSFGIDAISSSFNIVNSELEITSFLKETNYTQPIILGGGTNILFKNDVDKDILKINLKGIKIYNETNTYVDVSVGAGEIWDDLVKWSIAKNYGGLQNLSLIPGNVGSAPIQNIGAYGVELKETFLNCRAISIDSGSIKVFKNNECKFSYRSSIFKEELKNKYIISNVTFRLSKKDHQINFSYEPLRDNLIKKNISIPTINDISNSVIEIRSSKLPDPKIIGNCGSFFKNPIISKIDFKNLNQKEKNIPFFNISFNEIKIPAAWLIEKCGFKGLREGNTGTHNKHALIIINLGNATGKEIFDFSQKIKKAVLRKFNILLEEEVNII
ncbi:MAG: UDP-N-acetylenolpyruvoylglucosamine reductase [Flavobacteriaceae bacterium]|nr:UDP-N-acetylenolpyruvoylglucosamine reductase [Flavobacteriaceae bacterium]RCL66214.1 MAG: UDP-N-acetylmuramate dehydrogenase [Cryomorphaceae bacterium]